MTDVVEAIHEFPLRIEKRYSKFFSIKKHREFVFPFVNPSGLDRSTQAVSLLYLSYTSGEVKPGRGIVVNDRTVTTELVMHDLA